MDDSVSDIWFDEQGICKFCKIHDEMEKSHPISESNLSMVLQQIRKSNSNSKYNCIVGVSGGRDSTYTLLKAKEYGLRPLAVHFDNGWNSDISVRNIKNATNRLDVDLFTIVADWQEFRDLQVSFLRAGTPDADIPTDYAIYSVLYHMAKEEGIKYILNGHSFRTEGTSPISWTYMDPLYVRDVHKKHGSGKKFSSFPHMGVLKLQYYIWVKGIREIRLMEFIDYNKKSVDVELKEKLGWEYYGGHHHENHYTKFFQSYYLPQKFKIDKRKTELSALVRSGQINRSDAIEQIEKGDYEYEQATLDYAINKLEINTEEWENIMNTPPKSHSDYKTLLPLIRKLKYPIMLATKMKVLPKILYLKYAK
jgi:N-acetyl sugar amidotransferase